MEITEVYTIICLFAADDSNEVILKRREHKKLFSFIFILKIHYTVLGKV